MRVLGEKVRDCGDIWSCRDVHSHWRQPTSFCILYVMRDCTVLSVGVYGILSMGYPERYGVGTV